MKYRLALACCLLAFSTKLLSQGVSYEDYVEEDRKEFKRSKDSSSIDFPWYSINLGFLMGQPIGEFKDNTHKLKGFGLDIGGAFHWKESLPIYPGIGLSFMHYGRRKFTQDYDIDGTLVGLETTLDNIIVFPYFTLGVNPMKNRISPIVEFFLGPRLFSTDLSAQYEEDLSFLEQLLGSEPAEIDFSENQLSDWALAFGIKAGLAWKISRVASLELKFQYLDGKTAEYADRDDFEFNEQEQTFTLDNSRSETDMFAFDFGVRAYIN